MEAFYRPNFILYKEDGGGGGGGGGLKSKDYKSECCETTFTEKKEREASGDTPSMEDPQAKLLEDGDHVKIQTVSYEVEEEEYVEYGVQECVSVCVCVCVCECVSMWCLCVCLCFC